MIKKTRIFILLSFLSIIQNNAQANLSVYSEISIVTAGPGEKLYEKFGHAEIRIKDPVLNLDLIYNYGVFDFNQPNFLLNFADGKMYYVLARYDFKYFLASYKKDKRWVKQQVLDLTTAEKQYFFLYLESNALTKNATYLYDPFFNNCASKLRDITTKILNENVVLSSKNIQNKKTLRKLMNKEIVWNTWGNFGINLITGTILDIERNQLEYTYLPDYLFKTIKNAKIKRENKFVSLVKKEEVLLNFKEISNTTSIFNPLLLFTVLLFLVIFITYKDIKNQQRTKWLDFIIFFITGIVGLILSYFWFFSSHKTAPNNYNILWAFFPNLIVAFMITKALAKKWLSKYLMVLFACLLLVPVLWTLGLQVFPITAIPLLLLLLIRYLFLYTYARKF
jgi:membrane-associated HD superfamily phosphohydrolase